MEERYTLKTFKRVYLYIVYVRDVDLPYATLNNGILPCVTCVCIHSTMYKKTKSRFRHFYLTNKHHCSLLVDECAFSLTGQLF